MCGKSLHSQCLSQEAFSGHLSLKSSFSFSFGNCHAILICIRRHGDGGCHFGDTTCLLDNLKATMHNSIQSGSIKNTFYSEIHECFCFVLQCLRLSC